MVYIGSNERKLGNQLLRLLYLIFRAPMQADPKLKQLKDEFQIDLQPNNRKVVATMCNLSYGLVEEGMEKGLAKGLAEGMAQGRAEGYSHGLEAGQRQLLLNLLASGMSVEQIAASAKVPEAYVRKLAMESKGTGK